jgi:hypothetical protein
MVFNVVARNQDDCVNVAFLMNKRGEWSLGASFYVSFQVFSRSRDGTPAIGRRMRSALRR